MSKCCIQRLCVKCVSEWLLVKSGVPQGSGLGPILFLVFINDMFDVVKNTCKLFADDKKLLAKMDSLENIETFQNDICALCEWSER